MKIAVECSYCELPHFDHYECSCCGYVLDEYIICFWNKEDYERQSKKHPKWNYCPICGGALYEKDLLAWLEDFISMFEDAESPTTQNDYWRGYAQGCKETQETITARLKWAVDAEKEKRNAGIKN